MKIILCFFFFFDIFFNKISAKKFDKIQFLTCSKFKELVPNIELKKNLKKKMSERIPLPPFVLEYLRKKNVQIAPRNTQQSYNYQQPQNFQNLTSSLDSNATSSLELLSMSETPLRINGSYLYFVNNIVYNSPPFLQHEFRQFIFPIFISLANILYKQGFEQESQRFVDKYRYTHPSETQPIIDSLVEDPQNFNTPQFNIRISSEAYTELMVLIDKASYEPETAILSQVITNSTFNLEITETNDQFIFSNDDVASMLPGTLPLLNIVSFEMKPYSAMYNGELPSSKPQLISEDDIPLVHQNLPDIANIEVLNHDGLVTDIQISPNARLYSYAKGNNVYINSIDGVSLFNGKDSAILVSHRGKVLTTCFSPCSRLFASAGLDHIIKISQLEAFVPMLAIKAGIYPIYSLAFNSSSTLLSSGAGDMSVMIWNVSNGQLLRMFVGHTLPVTKLLFSSDSKRLISCSDDMTVRIWDVYREYQRPQLPPEQSNRPDLSYNLIATIHTHSPPTCVCLDPSNSHIAIGLRDGSVELWDSQKGIKLWQQKELETACTDIKITLDGSIIIASSLDGYLRYWRCDEKGEMLLTIDAISSSIDTICITERNSVLTAGRSLRGEVVL